jgi:hypothetical protein
VHYFADFETKVRHKLYGTVLNVSSDSIQSEYNDTDRCQNQSSSKNIVDDTSTNPALYFNQSKVYGATLPEDNLLQHLKIVAELGVLVLHCFI